MVPGCLGLKPVRDHKHIMGFPWLPVDVKARVRQSNSMVTRAMRRGAAAKGRRYWSMEHPYNSWAWEFNLAKEVEELEGYQHTVSSSCCFGGRREKWFSFLNNMPLLQ